MTAHVLVACEFSGVVRDAFRAQGFDAWSCDLLPTESVGPHICANVLDVLDVGWDLMIAHPPCTYLAASGERWMTDPRFPDRPQQREEAIQFVRRLMDAPIPRIAIENPIGKLSTVIRKPDQIIQPWMFGHEETKATCLWLKGLPPLVATLICERREPRIWLMGGKDKAHKRSITYRGIAEAMAFQWGCFL